MACIPSRWSKVLFLSLESILKDANLGVKHQVLHLIGQVSFDPEFVRQTQKSVLSGADIWSAQINVVHIRVL